MNSQWEEDTWSETQVLVSVVVPTYRRPELLDRCLEALVNQEFNPTAFEIIIVDDAASPETERLVADWKLHPRVYAVVKEQATYRTAPVSGDSLKFTAEPEPLPAQTTVLAGVPAIHYLATRGSCGPAAARNLGWRAARGAIVAFTDDDCLPDSNWLQNGFRGFQGEVDGVSGRMVVPIPEHPTDYELDAAGLERSQFVTANCFYRRKALEDIGGFDETFRLAWREDSDLLFRMIEAGYHLVEAQDVRVLHPVRPAPWGISVRQQRKSMYNALIYKKHSKLYRERLQRRPPLRYYAIVAALLTAVIAVIAGYGAIAVAAMGIWAALTLAFAALRLRGTAHNASHILEMLVTSAVIPPLCVYWRLRGAVKFRVLFI